MELHAEIIHFVNKKEALSGCSGHLNATFLHCSASVKVQREKEQEKERGCLLDIDLRAASPSIPHSHPTPAHLPPVHPERKLAASSGTWHRYYIGSGRAWCLVELRRQQAKNVSSEHGCVADTLCKVRKSFSSKEFVASQLITSLLLLTVCTDSFFSALLFYIFGEHLCKLLSHGKIINNKR